MSAVILRLLGSFGERKLGFGRVEVAEMKRLAYFYIKPVAVRAQRDRHRVALWAR